MSEQEQQNPFDSLVVGWSDGLPTDRSEQSVIESTLYTARLTSRHSALKRLLGGDTQAVEEEERRIRDEQTQDALGAVATVSTDDIGMSAKIAAQLKGEPQSNEEKKG